MFHNRTHFSQLKGTEVAWKVIRVRRWRLIELYILIGVVLHAAFCYSKAGFVEDLPQLFTHGETS
jgi:hypothetical protein